MHTASWPIIRYQKLWFITWQSTWHKIWIFFLPKKKLQLTVANMRLCHRGIANITIIDRFNPVTMYRHHRLMIQVIIIVWGHLLEFIYTLRLIYRVDIRIWTWGWDNWLQDQTYLSYLSQMLWSTLLKNGWGSMI